MIPLKRLVILGTSHIYMLLFWSFTELDTQGPIYFQCMEKSS